MRCITGHAKNFDSDDLIPDDDSCVQDGIRQVNQTNEYIRLHP